MNVDEIVRATRSLAVSRDNQCDNDFVLMAGYTPEESDELAEIAIQYDDPRQPVSVAEASEMLIKAAQHFEYDIDDVERIIDRLCEIPMVNPVSADDCAQGKRRC